MIFSQNEFTVFHINMFNVHVHIDTHTRYIVYFSMFNRNQTSINHFVFRIYIYYMHVKKANENWHLLVIWDFLFFVLFIYCVTSPQWIVDAFKWRFTLSVTSMWSPSPKQKNYYFSSFLLCSIHSRRLTLQKVWHGMGWDGIELCSGQKRMKYWFILLPKIFAHRVLNFMTNWIINNRSGNGVGVSHQPYRGT